MTDRMTDMNDQEFTERLWANPQDESAELTAALRAAPGRDAQRAQAREFDALLRRTLNSVSAPTGLRGKLLAAAKQEMAPRGRTGTFARDFMRRALPIAACLLVAVGVALYSRSSANAAFTEEVFRHVYQEQALLDGGTVMSIPEVNARLNASLGARIEGKNADKLKVTFAQDCWIARQIAFHMIMKGQSGAVSVMMIRNSPVSAELNIEDERFNGLITPTASGSLVVIGEKQEPIVEYRNLLSNNIKWEY